jgi:cytochrome oxidase Cu insertion factor (SCO1/SenC/PrrC family)
MSGPSRGSGARLQALAAALAGRPLFWILSLAILFSWPIVRAIRAERALPEKRPVVGAVRDFVLTDQNGDRFGAGELRGRVWVASFTAIQCAPMCGQASRMMKKASEIQHRTRNMGDAFRLVTLPADPERDTPARMSEYSTTYRASLRTWRFVSGPPAQVRSLLDDFGVAERTPQTRFVLVDPAMQIRGFYDLADDEALDLLLRDIGLLISRGG